MNDGIENLFKKDIFSKPGPNYFATPNGYIDTIVEVINESYQSIMDNDERNVRVFCVEGNELNSRNFLVDVKGEKYFIKRIHQDAFDKVVRISCLHRFLSSDLPVPTIINSDKNDSYAQHKDDYYIMMTCVDGVYFDGCRAQPLDSIAQSFSSLHSKIESFDDKSISFSNIEYTVGDEVDLWSFVLKKKDCLGNYLTADAADLIVESIDTVEKELSFTNFYNISAIMMQGLSLTHIDWHPYNLLINNDMVSGILDIESICKSYFEISIAFGAYKILRQYLIYNKYDRNSVKAIKSYIEQASPKPISMAELKKYAKLELLRRIFIILRFAFIKSDNRWTYVLPMHLAGLSETDYIFE